MMPWWVVPGFNLAAAVTLLVWVQVTPNCDCAWRNRWIRGHAIHPILVAWAWVITINTPLLILAREPGDPSWPIVLHGGAAGLAWWIVWRHGRHKRRWPQRLAGRVRVDVDRRRLVVEP